MIKSNQAKTGVLIALLSVGLLNVNCQQQLRLTPAPLPVNFNLAGQYALMAIQIDPALIAGKDVIAMYADSSGQSPCISGTTIRFNPTGWVTFTKPLRCEQNNDITKITGLHNGDKWSIQANTLLVDTMNQTTKYNLRVDGDQVILSWDIDTGYASSLDDDPPGFTLTMILKKL
ncbi:MAG: hypothetical protein JWP57_742 [Spirosoma sp.]|nr:hypothetical protein [Spirosoma sp.]